MAVKIGRVGKYLKDIKRPVVPPKAGEEAAPDMLVASGGLAVHPAADMTDEEIDAVSGGKPMESAPMSPEEREKLRLKYGIGRQGPKPPTVQEIEAEIQSSAEDSVLPVIMKKKRKV